MIWNNPSINTQSTQLQWETWVKGGIWKLSELTIYDTEVPFSKLKSKCNLKDRELFRYMQLKNWITRSLFNAFA